MDTLHANGYSIAFADAGYQALNDLIKERNYSSIFVVSDTDAAEHCTGRFMPRLETDARLELIEFESGESSKTIETCVELWNILTELGADRKSLIVNLGGGVVTDLGGFVAATFKRGIDFVHVPTTLLAMVDAAIGGKNGVDLGPLKNQVGVIVPPRLVLIDTVFLETLPQEQMRSGLAEMLKHGLIYDRSYWDAFLDLSGLDLTQLDALIHRSIEIKNEIVAQDPTEKGIRKALNFGHTLGHAIESHFLESAHKKTLLHGEAIAAGMIMESYLSRELGLLSREEYAQVKYVISDLFENLDFSREDLDAIIGLMAHDKKNEYGRVQFALLHGIGKTAIDQNADNELIISAFDDYQS